MWGAIFNVVEDLFFCTIDIATIEHQLGEEVFSFGTFGTLGVGREFAEQGECLIGTRKGSHGSTDSQTVTEAGM